MSEEEEYLIKDKEEITIGVFRKQEDRDNALLQEVQYGFPSKRSKK